MDDALPNADLGDELPTPGPGILNAPVEPSSNTPTGSLLLRANMNSPFGGGGSPLVATAARPVVMPAGHPPAAAGEMSSCPFALIQAALESQSANASPASNPSTGSLPPVATRQRPPSTAETLKGFQSSTLDGTVIPESVHVTPSKLQEGIEEGLQPLEQGSVHFSSRGNGSGKGAQLMCPVSGEVTAFGGEDVKPDDAVARAAKLGLGAETPAEVVGGGGGSRAASRAGSGEGSQARSKQSGSRRSKGSGSKASKATSKNKVRRRVKKTIKFSEWEADTYIPQIKESWAICMKNTSVEAVGLDFLDSFLRASPDLSHMFTSAREVLSIKFAEMLTSIVGSVDNPSALHEQLKGLAPMHLKLGVKKEYLPRFGETLVSCISNNLKDEFSETYRAAWEWLWSWLSQSMIQSLEEASNEATVLSQSWDMAMDNCPGNEFGEMLFEVLFELAPNMKTLFNKPKQILSVKFMEMLSTLVSFNGDQKRMAEQSVWLGMRHVRYGARPQHIQVLGQVVMTCLERAVGDEWTAEMDRSWTELWTTACNTMLKVPLNPNP